MSCKIAYSHLFTHIHTHIISMKCGSYTTDYERAMRQALKALMKKIKAEAENNTDQRCLQFETSFRCCWFHFCQAVKRRGSKIAAFFDVVRKVPDLLRIYYKLLSLPLLPARIIDEMFQKLRDAFISIASQHNVDVKPLNIFRV